MAGLHLDPWQQYVMRGALSERADGKWAAFEVGLIVSRQNGKGSIIEARELAGLFLLKEQLILHSAHEFKTCAEGFRRLLFLIENTPDLSRRVKRVTRSHGDEGIELKTGQRIRFVARTGGSGRGFSGDLIILDEAMILGSDSVGALLPTLSARPNPQVWYTSSAGMESSTQLARLVRRGRAGGDSSLAYFEWSAGDDDPHDEPETWAKANPALGLRISQEHIAREMAAMEFTEFARERLGIGTYPAEGGDLWSVIDEETWLGLADQSSELLDPVTFAIDVAPDRSMATIAAAGTRADGKGHIEIVDHDAGTGWVVGRIQELHKRWRPKAIGIDPGGPAGSLVASLESAGVELYKIATRDLAQACGGFYDAATSDGFRHRGQLELSAAVRGARKRGLGDAWAWSRRDASVNLSPLVAGTIAFHAHKAVGSKSPEPSVRSLADYLGEED